MPRFLIQEDSFMFGRPLLSSWDVNKVNGTISGNAYENFLIEDEVILNRKFDEQSSGKVVLEITFQLLENCDGFFLGFDDLGIHAEEGQLFFSDKSCLGAYREGFFNGLRMGLDYDKNRIEINLNDQRTYINYVIPPIDTFTIQTVDGSKSTVQFVRLYANYILYEKFHTTPVGMSPSGWKIDTDCKARIFVGELDDVLWSDNRYLAVEDARSTASALSRTFDAQTGQFNVMLKYFMPYSQPYDKVGPTFSFCQGGEKAFSFNPRVDGVYVNDECIYRYKVKESIWHQIFINFDVQARSVHFRINGKNSIVFRLPENVIWIDRFGIDTKSGGWTKVWVADLMISPILPTPEDYPTDPKIPKKSGEYYVGMHCCNMWREGMHLGWDAIEPYPDRRPYLGYYTEGLPEVSDWEIKWQTEHGVDFQLWCWYPSDHYRGGPVRVLPMTEHALHYGYMNAKYRNSLKFAINNMWYPVNTKAFRDHIVPFWIEYYITNENYLVIDNKPFISPGELGETEEEKKANAEYLIEACKKAGFDGATLVSGDDHQQKFYHEQVKRAGYDEILTYGWGYISHIDGRQQDWMTIMRENDVMPVIATVSMGYNMAAWTSSARGGFGTPEVFKKVLYWARDEHMPYFSKDKLSSKMVVLDNWNEYGEGHFLMPTNLYGFDYLDAVREVFTENEEHMDERPTQQSLMRMQQLYPKGRKTLKTVKAGVPFPTKVKKGWYFDNQEDAAKWKAKEQIVNLRVEDGLLKGDVIGKTPRLYLDDDFKLDITTCPYVRITAKLVNCDRMLNSFFFHNEKGKEECLNHYISIRDIETIYMDCPPNGVVSNFEFMPMQSTGSFEIKSIEFMEYDKLPIYYVFEGMTDTFFAEPIWEEDTMFIPIRGMEDLLGVSVHWDWKENIIRLSLKDNTVLEYGKDEFKIIDRIAYFPLLSLCNKLGFNVEYDTEKLIVTIEKA